MTQDFVKYLLDFSLHERKEQLREIINNDDNNFGAVEIYNNDCKTLQSLVNVLEDTDDDTIDSWKEDVELELIPLCKPYDDHVIFTYEQNGYTMESTISLFDQTRELRLSINNDQLSLRNRYETEERLAFLEISESQIPKVLRLLVTLQSYRKYGWV